MTTKNEHVTWQMVDGVLTKIIHRTSIAPDCTFSVSYDTDEPDPSIPHIPPGMALLTIFPHEPTDDIAQQVLVDMPKPRPAPPDDPDWRAKWYASWGEAKDEDEPC